MIQLTKKGRCLLASRRPLFVESGQRYSRSQKEYALGGQCCMGLIVMHYRGIAVKGRKLYKRPLKFAKAWLKCRFLLQLQK